MEISIMPLLSHIIQYTCYNVSLHFRSSTSIFCVFFCLVVSVFLSIRFFLCFSAFFPLMCLNFKVNSCLFPMIFFYPLEVINYNFLASLLYRQFALFSCIFFLSFSLSVQILCNCPILLCLNIHCSGFCSISIHSLMEAIHELQGLPICIL